MNCSIALSRHTRHTCPVAKGFTPSRLLANLRDTALRGVKSIMIRKLFPYALLAFPALGCAEPLQHELLVFGSAQTAATKSYENTKENDDGLLLAADVLFSLQRDHFKVFGEYLLTNREGDLERFQLGWEPTSNTTVWLGRYHQPGSFWNHEHHHGRYLQTAITRPAAEDWEDDEGVIPQHYFGALIESTWHLPNNQALTTAFGGGLAPTLQHDGLEAFDVLHPEPGRHRFGFQMRVAWMADELSDTGAGVMFARGKLNVDDVPPPSDPALDHVDQTVIGAFANYVREPWRASIVGYHVRAVMLDEGLASRSASQFQLAYAQIERDLPGQIRVFGREEISSGVTQSSYLQLFPEFVTQRLSLGARWDFVRRHALTVQISDTHIRSHSFAEFRLQWSAALL
jgi:hypothetical protein